MQMTDVHQGRGHAGGPVDRVLTQNGFESHLGPHFSFEIGCLENIIIYSYYLDTYICHYSF